MRARLTRVALLAVIASARLIAQPTDRDIWVGVLMQEMPVDDDGHTPDEPTTEAELAMLPVAALVGGTWRLGRGDQGEVHVGTSGSPVYWEPAELLLPLGWMAWLADGPRVPFEYSTPLRRVSLSDSLGVGTGMPTSAPLSYEAVMGVAVSGDVEVRMFSDVVGSTRDVLPEALRRALLAEERVALRSTQVALTSTTEGCDHTWTKAVKRFSAERLPTLPYEVTHHRVATRSNGARTIVFHGDKCLASSNGDCAVLTSEAAIEVGPNARTSLLYAHANVICNDLSMTYVPIAILERDGRTCWLSENQYEDGSVYTFTGAGQPWDPPTCGIQ